MSDGYLEDILTILLPFERRFQLDWALHMEPKSRNESTLADALVDIAWGELRESLGAGQVWAFISGLAGDRFQTSIKLDGGAICVRIYDEWRYQNG